MFGAAEAVSFQIIRLEKIQNLQRSDALSVRRQLPDIVTAVVGADRRDPLALMRSQVFIAQEAVVGLEIGVNTPGDGTLVERIASFMADDFQGAGQIRIAPAFASAWRAFAVHGELFGKTRPLRQGWHTAAPVVGDGFMHGVTLARIGDGRCQILRHAALAEAGMQCEPGVHRARHGHRKRAM